MYEHYFLYIAASLPIAQRAGITVGAVVIVISLPTIFVIFVMCYIRRKRLREKNSMNTIFMVHRAIPMIAFPRGRAHGQLMGVVRNKTRAELCCRKKESC